MGEKRYLGVNEIEHNQGAYNLGIERFKLIVKPHKKILGFTCLTIGIIPNGLGWLFIPLGVMFLRNSTLKGLKSDLKTQSYNINVIIKRMLRDKFINKKLKGGLN